MDASINRYGYPSTKGADYFEVLTRFEKAVGVGSVGLAFGYVPRQENTGNEDNVYAAKDAARPISGGPFKMVGSLGWEDGSFGRNKIDWLLGAVVEVGKATIGLSYVGASQADRDHSMEAGFVLSIGTSF